MNDTLAWIQNSAKCACRLSNRQCSMYSIILLKYLLKHLCTHRMTFNFLRRAQFVCLNNCTKYSKKWPRWCIQWSHKFHFDSHEKLRKGKNRKNVECVHAVNRSFFYDDSVAATTTATVTAIKFVSNREMYSQITISILRTIMCSKANINIAVWSQ